MASTDGNDWRVLYRAGALGAFATVVMIPIQIAAFVIWPPTFDVETAFAVFAQDWFRGLESLDLLLVVDTVFNILVFLAVGAALWRTNKSAVLIALALLLAGSAAYFSSNTSFEILDLAGQYAAASDPEVRSQLLAAGRFALSNFQGTAFAVYYVLGGVEILLISWAMLQGRTFSRFTAWLGLIAGIVMLVPPLPAIGQIGIALSLLSLAPWIVWLFLVGRTLWRLAAAGPAAA
jgi:hypothetical protein